MKRNFISAFALISTSLSPVLVTPAWAAPVNPAINQAADSSPVTASDMQDYCNSNYVTNASLERSSVTGETAVADASTPTADTQNINARPDTTSSFVYAQFLYAANPLTRTGGSVNMWGQSVFGQKIWDNTLYDVNTRFEHSVRYNWTCHVDTWQIVSSHVVTTPGTPPEGFYTNPGTNPSGGQGSCQGINSSNPHWGEDIGACIWTQTAPGTEETTTTVDDYGWAPYGDFAAVEVVHGPISDGFYTTETDVQQLGHVTGVNYTETGTFTPSGVRSLACINPGKKGGSWTVKNGYTGGNCNTTYFNNTAQTAYGFTFDTVNGVLPSASLPQ